MGGGYDNEGYVGSKDQNYNVSKGGGGDSGVIRPAVMTESEIRKEKIRIMKNVCVISFSFLCLFTAFQSMANLQSSINKVGGKHFFTVELFYIYVGRTDSSHYFTPLKTFSTDNCRVRKQGQ